MSDDIDLDIGDEELETAETYLNPRAGGKGIKVAAYDTIINTISSIQGNNDDCREFIIKNLNSMRFAGSTGATDQIKKVINSIQPDLALKPKTTVVQMAEACCRATSEDIQKFANCDNGEDEGEDMSEGGGREQGSPQMLLL